MCLTINYFWGFHQVALFKIYISSPSLEHILWKVGVYRQNHLLKPKMKRCVNMNNDFCRQCATWSFNIKNISRFLTLRYSAPTCNFQPKQKLKRIPEKNYFLYSRVNRDDINSLLQSVHRAPCMRSVIFNRLSIFNVKAPWIKNNSKKYFHVQIVVITVHVFVHKMYSVKINIATL